MSTVLYRKYRPKSFDDLVGQNHIKIILQEVLKSGNIPHAFLFSGPRGTGKTTTARLLARAINKIPDDQYEEALRSTDIIEMDAASNRGVEEMQQLKETIGFMPTLLEKKIYIIDEVHMLSNTAFNSLLKTLEEPPEHVVFIMATTEPHKVPITILSRVQRHDFRLGSKEEVISKLRKITKNEGFTFDDGALEIIYRVSGGSYRDAESTLAKVIQSVSDKKVDADKIREVLGIVSEDIFDELTKCIISSKKEKIIELMNFLQEKNTSWDLFLNEFIRFIHAKIVTKSGDIQKNHQIFNALVQTIKDIKYFDQKKILIEISLLQLLDAPILDEQSAVQPQTQVAPKKVAAKVSKSIPKKKPEVTQSSPKKVSKAVIAVEEGTPKSDLLVAVESNKRLKAILLTSDISIENDICTIKNEYNFNIKYLEKADISNFLRDALGNNGYNVNTLNFEVGVSGEHAIEEVSKQSPVATDTKKAKKKDSVKKTGKDNSALVESMF